MTASPKDWEAQEPSADLADRVMERIHAELQAPLQGKEALRRARRLDPRLPGRRIASGAIVAAALLAFGFATESLLSSSRAGDIAATARAEVHFGRRGVGVLEAGAHVSWKGDDVSQSSGEVFYRVESDLFGHAFSVHTAAADVQVQGTCFKVQVENGGGAVLTRATGTSSPGATREASVLVSVLEGSVTVSHAESHATLRAGEVARVNGHGISRFTDTNDATPSQAGQAPDSLLAANANLADSVREYGRRLDALAEEKRKAEQQLKDAKDRLALAQANGGAKPTRSQFDLTEDDWKGLAKEGKVRALFPCPDPESWTQSQDVIDALGVSGAQATAIHDALEDSAARVWASIRPYCAEMVGGSTAVANKLGPSACQSFLLRAGSPSEEEREQLRKVAEIRAGLIPMPTDPSVLGTFGRAWYTLTGETKAIEAQLSRSISPEVAQEFLYGTHPAPRMCVISKRGGPRPEGPKP